MPRSIRCIFALCRLIPAIHNSLRSQLTGHIGAGQYVIYLFAKERVVL